MIICQRGVPLMMSLYRTETRNLDMYYVQRQEPRPQASVFSQHQDVSGWESLEGKKKITSS